jgi:hypothetical protein
MARRLRSFFFDNKNGKLFTGVNYTLKDIENEVEGTESIDGTKVSDFARSAIQTSSKAFLDSDVVLMTAAAIDNRINFVTDSVIDSAPGALDTLNELAAALGDDANFSTTVTNSIATKLPSASYTAADVLTKIKTVDGTGSGLDADLLDGQQGTYYYPASNPNGYTTNVGTITGVTAGVGLSGGGTSGTVTVTVDLSELTDMTAAMVGTDEFIVLDAGADRRKAANEIGLSIFNNDAGFTTNVGDITGVTAGSYLTGGGTSGTVTLNVDATTTNTASKVVARDASGNFAAGTITAALSGNATTATTLATARTINGVSFNGSANITVEAYVENDDSTNATRYITFVDDSTAAFKRLNEDTNLTYNPSTNTLTAGTFSGALSGNATTATKWAVGRALTLSGDVSGTATFDGSGSISLTTTVADDSHNHVISNIDGLQAALDAKTATGKAIAMAMIFGG